MSTSSEPLRFGVLGCASVAWRRMMPALRGSPDARLVAVAGREEARTRRFAETFGCDPVHGYPRLLERPDVDAVYVALPTGLHAEWATRAMEAGKHVLVEKPMATSPDEARDLVAAARAHGVRLMENRMFVHHPQHRSVQDLVEGGAVGEVRVFTSGMAIPPLPADDIRYRPDLGGGALLDVGFYPVHAALLFLGPSLEVAGAVLRHDARTGVDVGGDVLLRSADGVAAHLTFGFEHAYRSWYELWGDRGRIVLERAFTPPPDREPVVEIVRDSRRETVRLGPSDQFRRIVERFAAVVRGEADGAGHLETTVRGLALLESIRKNT
ncbi:MAG TPA: Gfo/Idh/MocA family oxidoreductase [Thermomonospora sp.]|nr:Gfo/Idh/MocA family oxidoreductase [Thermomonospora sp.]